MSINLGGGSRLSLGRFLAGAAQVATGYAQGQQQGQAEADAQSRQDQQQQIAQLLQAHQIAQQEADRDFQAQQDDRNAKLQMAQLLTPQGATQLYQGLMANPPVRKQVPWGALPAAPPNGPDPYAAYRSLMGPPAAAPPSAPATGGAPGAAPGFDPSKLQFRDPQAEAANEAAIQYALKQHEAAWQKAPVADRPAIEARMAALRQASANRTPIAQVQANLPAAPLGNIGFMPAGVASVPPQTQGLGPAGLAGVPPEVDPKQAASLLRQVGETRKRLVALGANMASDPESRQFLPGLQATIKGAPSVIETPEHMQQAQNFINSESQYLPYQSAVSQKDQLRAKNDAEREDRGLQMDISRAKTPDARLARIGKQRAFAAKNAQHGIEPYGGADFDSTPQDVTAADGTSRKETSAEVRTRLQAAAQAEIPNPATQPITPYQQAEIDARKATANGAAATRAQIAKHDAAIEAGDAASRTETARHNRATEGKPGAGAAKVNTTEITASRQQYNDAMKARQDFEKRKDVVDSDPAFSMYGPQGEDLTKPRATGLPGWTQFPKPGSPAFDAAGEAIRKGQLPGAKPGPGVDTNPLHATYWGLLDKERQAKTAWQAKVAAAAKQQAQPRQTAPPTGAPPPATAPQGTAGPSPGWAPNPTFKPQHLAAMQQFRDRFHRDPTPIQAKMLWWGAEQGAR